MAVIVPILMYVSGASAAIGAAVGLSATAVSSIASIAFQVTGVNDKINKAAGKVFGEDFVKIANIAGAVYGAVSTMGSGLGGAAEGAAAAGGTLSKAALDGTTAFGANSIGMGALDLATGSTVGAFDYSLGAGAGPSVGIKPPANAFNVADSAVGIEQAGSVAPSARLGVNLANAPQAVEVASGPGLKLPEPVLRSVADVGEGAAAANASVADASVAAQAPLGQQLAQTAKAVEAARPVDLLARTRAAIATTGTTGTTAPSSFFDRLLSSDKAVGAVVQGVGGAISSAASSKAQKDALDFAKRKYTSVSGMRVA